MRLTGWALGLGGGDGAGAEGLGLGTEAQAMPSRRGGQGAVAGVGLLTNPFTVSCGEVWSCSSVAALLALSPTCGSLSSEQENETGSPE